MIVKELLGEVSKGFVTFVTVRVKFVEATAIESRLILSDVDDVMLHLVAMAVLVKEQVESVTLSPVSDGKVTITNDPVMSLFTVTNHSS